MKKFMHIAGAFIAATLAASIVASMFSTQFVIASLNEIGIEVPLADRFSMTLGDLAILQTLAIVVAVCFLVGFLVAWIARRYIGGNRKMWLIVAGACALTGALLTISTVLQIAPIAGARSTIGLLFQGVAGGFGGYVFASLSKPNVTEAVSAQNA